MRRFLLLSSLLAGLVAFGSKPAGAGIAADINIHVGDRYPVYWNRAPRMVLVPQTDVYWYDNASYDCYRVGNMYYVNDGGYWYSSRSWRGPFVGVRYTSVPQQVLRMPYRYRHQSSGYWAQQAPQRSWNNDRYDRGGGWSSSNDRGGWYGQSDRTNRNDRRNDQWNNHRGDQGNHGRGHGNNGRGRGHDDDDD